jgi:hypothetical protein
MNFLQALFKHLLNTIVAYCGDFILHTKVHLMSRKKNLFGLRDLPETVMFLQDRGHLKDSRCLLHLDFVKDLTAKLNELTIE